MEKCYRVGAVAVIFAVLLRLGCSSLPQKAAAALSTPEATRLILFTETGRWVELPKQTEHQFESATPLWLAAPEPLGLSIEDTQLIALQNAADIPVDISALLQRPLQWDLTGDEPTVLILHTHASESYAYTGGYKEDSAYRTLDENHNMLSVGQALAEYLQQAGLSVLQDRSLHDYPSYNGSYVQARSALAEYLEEYPSIRLVLDLHRDAMEDRWGNQVAQTCTVHGREAARVMLVVGANHDNWEDNMALAVKLQAHLEQLYPGLCRPIAFRGQRFNQDLCPGGLLIEIGAAGNTHEQALYTAELLSHAIINLQHGCTIE